ncbi:MAG: sodium-translocating pyrophosphatase [Polyangiaceae bacterium]|nr:sodium-translocating pyrophosphatase [Polyangiaceae bacterium]
MIELGLVVGISLLGLGFAAFFSRSALGAHGGTREMQAVSDAIRSGSEAFLRRQNRTILLLAAAVAAALFAVVGFVRKPQAFDPATKLELAGWTAGAFTVGALFSVLAGYVGMWISIRANLRVAGGARRSLDHALRAALRSGAVAGLFVVILSMLGLAGLFVAAYALKGGFSPSRAAEAARVLPKIPLMIAGYAFGASFVALFAQVGGGIYTKAADVGADLVGKVEAGIPEDDPRNPAVIADLVGDNVGDCAGRGADLFESISAENIGAMILAASLYQANPNKLGTSALGVLMFPLVMSAFGVLASVFGVLSVKTDGDEAPTDALKRGFYVTVTLSLTAFAGATIWMFGPYWFMFFACGAIGLGASLAFVWITLHYTEADRRPVQRIAEASEGGPATNVIGGIAVGLESTVLPILVVAASILGAYKLGDMSGLTHGGLFGTAVAVMGMLGTSGYVLAMDTFGPITDNAGGIVEMSLGHLEPSVRERTDKLDAAGNTTKALTKGYAVGSAALAAFLLFSAVIDEVNNYARPTGRILSSINLNKPAVFVGAMLGAMLVFWFSSMCIRAVGKSAQAVIAEVRRQFADLPREGGRIVFPDGYQPDYGRCVDIVTADAQKQMVLPGLLAVAAPVAVGLFFKYLRPANDPLLAAEATMSFLMVGTVTGVLMALFLNNAGGAWDNAKKYIESGAHGGKLLLLPDGRRVKNPVHQAAVVGDTVGDPFKDTAGPSLHVLVKLLATVTLVVAPLFL